jgi:ATP-binding cassette subfamily B protein/subfamily B ATP-binding cassette protein MsbA
VGPAKKTSKQRYETFREEHQKRVKAAVLRALPRGIARHFEAKPTDELPHPATRDRLEGTRRQRLLRYRAWLKPGKADLLLVAALGFVGIVLDMLWPLVSQALVDRVILDRRMVAAEKTRYLLWGAAFMASVFLLNSSLNWWRSLRHQLLASRLQVGLRVKLFSHILKLPLQELHELRVGGLLSRLSGDVDQTASLVQQAFLSPLMALLRLVVTLSIIFTLDRRIATAVILAMPPILFIQAVWARKMRGVWRSISLDRQDIDGRVSEGLEGIRVVRAFRRESREEAAQQIGLHTVIRKQLLATRTQRAIGTIWELVMPLTQVTILCYGGYLVTQGQTTLGTVVAFQGYLWRLLEPVLSLANSITDTQRGLAAMDRVFELLEKPADKPDVDSAIDAPREVESIAFRNVGFCYRPDVPVIADFELEVKGGSVVALVGPSGAGKTTLTDLLARFHDPSTGFIAVNGVDLRHYRLKSYRKLLGIVSQDVFLFDGTVSENISYARTDATEDEIERAARAANAHEFIQELPEGYDTLVGERGVKLSGGQRQRLSIARALLADPQILILDEATSNLDTKSEHLIQQALQTLVRSRTTFIIAHRLSTVQMADVICVIDRGRLVEQGTHRELVERQGLYAQMVLRQHHDPAHTLSTSGFPPPETETTGDDEARKSRHAPVGHAEP